MSDFIDMVFSFNEKLPPIGGGHEYLTNLTPFDYQAEPEFVLVIPRPGLLLEFRLNRYKHHVFYRTKTHSVPTDTRLNKK